MNGRYKHDLIYVSACIYLLLSGCSFNNNVIESNYPDDEMASQTTEHSDSEIDYEINNELSGWSIDGNIIKYENRDVHAIVDLDRNSDKYIETSFANDNDIYVAYYSEQEKSIAIEFSHDGGSTWKTTYLEYEEYGGIGAVYLSFLNESNGYLLYCSDASAGMMSKILFYTKDGGITFERVCDLSEKIKNYPTDMGFCNQDTGLILTRNHGDESYAFITEDGGHTWNEYRTDLQGQDLYTYIEGISIDKIDYENNIWYMKLCGVSENERNEIILYSADEWLSWEQN